MNKWQIRYKETGKTFNHLMKGNKKREAAQNNIVNKDKFTPETVMDLIFYVFILSLIKAFFFAVSISQSIEAITEILQSPFLRKKEITKAQKKQ